MSRPFVPLADGAQAELRYDFGLGIISTRLWFVSRQPPVDFTQLGNLADGLQAWQAAELMPLLSQDLVTRRVRAIDWTAPGGAIAVSTNTGVVGGSSDPSHSANVAAKVIFLAPQPPRHFENWNYVPGVPLGAVNNNTLDTTFADNLKFAYVDIIDLAPLWGPFPAWRWVCTSQEVLGTPRTTQLADRVDFISVRPVVSQRRARLKHT